MSSTQEITYAYINSKSLTNTTSGQIFHNTLSSHMKHLVCTLSAQIRKANKSSQSESMRMAWQIVKQEKERVSLLTFEKKDGTVCKRVVSAQWEFYHKITGTGRPVKEGLKLFADIGKHFSGLPCIISAYEGKFQIN